MTTKDTRPTLGEVAAEAFTAALANGQPALVAAAEAVRARVRADLAAAVPPYMTEGAEAFMRATNAKSDPGPEISDRENALSLAVAEIDATRAALAARDEALAAMEQRAKSAEAVTDALCDAHPMSNKLDLGRTFLQLGAERERAEKAEAALAAEREKRAEAERVREVIRGALGTAVAERDAAVARAERAEAALAAAYPEPGVRHAAGCRSAPHAEGVEMRGVCDCGERLTASRARVEALEKALAAAIAAGGDAALTAALAALKEP